MIYHFVVFGEDHNDQQAICMLIAALAPNGTEIRTETRRKPMILSRNAGARKRRSMASDIATFTEVLQRSDRRVIAVVHRDCDAIEPSHRQERAELHADLEGAGVSEFVVANPSWEIEAWWMLFPLALASTRPCWELVDYSKSSVGMIEHAKERLTRDLRPRDRARRARCPDYQEMDSLTIARKISENPQWVSQIKARSLSFEAFRDDLAEVFAGR